MTAAAQRAVILWGLVAFWLAVFLIGGLLLMAFVAVICVLFLLAVVGLSL